MDQIWKFTMKTNFNLNILYSYLQTNKKGLLIKSNRDIQYAKKKPDYLFEQLKKIEQIYI